MIRASTSAATIRGAALFIIVGAIACEADTTCTPLQAAECWCEDVRGYRVCNNDGSAWSECRCIGDFDSEPLPNGAEGGPCLPDGSCSSGLVCGHDETCESCPMGGQGEDDGAPCFGAPCGQGLCAVAGDSFHCTCLPGFTGQTCSASSIAGGGTTFTKGTTSSETGYGRSAALVDIDMDGDLDLLAIFDEGIGVLLGDGDGNFGSLTVIGESDIYQSDKHGDLQFADFNGDGFPDFVVYGVLEKALELWLNDGSGDFFVSDLVEKEGSIAAGYYSVGVADFNEDGTIDVVAGASRNKVYYFFSGDGEGHLTEGHEIRSTGYKFTLGDYDRDGHVDLMTSDPLSVMQGVGDGSFFPQEFLEPQHLDQYSTVDTVDLDSDGDLDIFRHISSSSGHVLEFRKASLDCLAPVLVSLDIPEPESFSGPIAADLDGDLVPELILEIDHRIHIIRAAGDELTIQESTDVDGGLVGLGDVNGDGLLDIVYQNYEDETFGTLLGSH